MTVNNPNPRFASTATDTTTIYVAASGNDLNSGLEWTSAKLTINAALAALPARGGIIEVGYGSFAGFTIPEGQFGVTVRGRGPGQGTSITDVSVPAPGHHPTLITSSITIEATLLSGGLPESDWLTYTRLEDMAVTTSSGNGLNLETPYFSANRMYFVSCAGDGVNVSSGNTFFGTWRDCRFERCGGYGFNGNTQNHAFLVCNFDGNTSGGWYAGASGTCEDMSFFGCSFQRNSGPGLSGALGSYINIFGGHIEGNSSTYQINISTGALNMWGCFVLGDSAAQYGIRWSASLPVNIRGCRFSGHTISSINSIQGTNYLVGCLESNFCTDPNYITGFMTTSIPAGLAPNRIDSQIGTARSINQQTLAANGAVTMNASIGDIQQILLQANATSSSITNPCVGQKLTIEWVQDGTGSRTYAWPSNVRFAGNTAPAATATANRKDVVTFWFDPLNSLWTELSRSVNVPVI